jgi:CIC family chloride channel protein
VAAADDSRAPAGWVTEHAGFGLVLIVVSLGAAAFAIAFRLSLSAVYRGLYRADNVVDAIAGLPAWGRVAVPLAGATCAGLLAGWRMSRAQGVSSVMEAVALGRVRLSVRATMRRVAGSWTAIASGLSIGREGPLIEFGGALGARMAGVARASAQHTRTLVAAGTAAGFAAAYNTPFAAVLFVLETIIGIVALDALIPAIVATVLATALTRAVVGGGPIYGSRTFGLVSPADLFSYGAVGVLAAGAAVVFRRMLALMESAVKRYHVPQPWRAALGGAIVGLIVLGSPSIAGNGYEPLNRLLDGQYLVTSAIVWLVVAKIVATSASVSSGIPGGIFTPVLFVGGAIGALAAPCLHWLGLPVSPDTGSYALVGMAATAAATIHAPLSAAVMVFELTGDYAIVLPLLLATVVATWLARARGGESIYEAELRRRGIGWELTLDGRQVERVAETGTR